MVHVAEKYAHVRIVRPDQAYLLPEQVHLARFFQHFSVDCVFDVGANRGQYARMLRKNVQFRGPIVSFEPIPALAQTLRHDAMSDPLWHIDETALDQVERDTSFNIMEFDQFSSLRNPSTSESGAFELKNKIARTIVIHTATLQEKMAEYAAKLGFARPFLKMDTQGHDLEVARSAGSSLGEFVGIQSELAIKKLYDGAPNFIEALEFYATRGFEISALVPNYAGHFPDLFEIDCILFRSGVRA